MKSVTYKNPSLHGYDIDNNVLNGIAYDEKEDVFYITGKRWDHIFKIKVLEDRKEEL